MGMHNSYIMRPWILAHLLFMHLHQQLGHLHLWCFWYKLLELCALKLV